MRKVAHEGSSAPRTIFRVILVAGIAAGINSVHAASISCSKITNGPRAVKVQYTVCPVCQSSSSEFSGYGKMSHHHFANGGGGGQFRSSGGELHHFGRGMSQNGGSGSRYNALGQHQGYGWDDYELGDVRGYEHESPESQHDDPRPYKNFDVRHSTFDPRFEDPLASISFTNAKGLGGGGGGSPNIIRRIDRGNSFGSATGNILFRGGGRHESYRPNSNIGHLEEEEEEEEEDDDDDDDNDDGNAAAMSHDTGSFSIKFGDKIAPLVRKRLVVDSSNRNGYMLPTDVINSVEELANDSSLFYVTFACQPKVGKYICKLQCAKRGEGMTGTCDSGYCTCLFKEEKAMGKKMNKRFLAGVRGFKHDCVYDAKHCKRFCKSLTPDKSFTGVCTDNFCKCVTYPHNPDKKSACQKAIKKLKQIEEMALGILGVPPVQTASSASIKADAATDKIMNHVMASQNVEGCSPEDYTNLRNIISNLTRRLKFAKRSGATLTHSSVAQFQETRNLPSWTPTTLRSLEVTETPSQVARGPGRPDSPLRRLGYASGYDSPKPDTTYRYSFVNYDYGPGEPGPEQ